MAGAFVYCRCTPNSKLSFAEKTTKRIANRKMKSFCKR
ncbi:hypothetical protein wVul_1036 [Wolbachia endosymbiont of Armadillidium vulgare str. wVulC]|nr:hypothetical protein wVul_1036 [Wolbachia endosymbiont of Armadillidium vulgare str. wVulC]